MRAVFVGDKPSKRNTDPSIPFIGTKSWTRLEEWIERLGVSWVILRNQDTLDISDPELYGAVVALGRAAETKLNHFNISFFAMPHPSGLNRKLNDKKYIDRQIKRCEAWIKERQK